VCALTIAVSASQDFPFDVTATVWSELGASATGVGISNLGGYGATGKPSVAVNRATGDIYVAYPAGIDDDNDEIYVKRWNGSAWVEVGAGSATGGGISQSPTTISESPRIAVRASDGHLFVVWREYSFGGTLPDNIFAAEYNGATWSRLGPDNGRVSDIGTGADANARSATQPQLILSDFVSTDEQPVVAWRCLTNFNSDAIYVKRWTGVAWVEMGAGSASRYTLPHTNTFNAGTGRWELGDFQPARGINADDGSLDRLYPLPAVAGPTTFSETGFDHQRSFSPILIKNNFGRPTVVFKNGASRNNLSQYPYGIHVRSFTGDNSQPAYLAWEEVGRVPTGQTTSGYVIIDGDTSATWGENGTPDLYVATGMSATGQPRLLRVLKWVGTSWVTVGPDVASGATFGYAPSVVKDGTGRVILAWHSGDGSQIYVAGSAAGASSQPIWAEIGAGSASAGGVSANATMSGFPDIAVDGSTSPESLIAAWQDDAPAGVEPQIYLRATRPVVGGTGPPGAPAGLTATSSGSSITLSWSAPVSGGAPTSYVIEAGSATGLANLANFATGHTNPTFSASGVPNGTYFVRIRASNAAGVGVASNEATLVVGPVPPGPPRSVAANSTGNTVMISWAPPASGGAPTSYQIEAGSAPGLANLANFPTGGIATSFSATGVPNGTYYLRVRASNAAGVSGSSNEVTLNVGTPMPPPGAPSNLTASVSGSTVTLSWTAPSSGGAPSTYMIDVGTAPGLTNFGSFPSGGTTTSITATGVGNGTYYVRVRATNPSGSSGPSNEGIVRVGP
jgi:hypothetical protein